MKAEAQKTLARIGTCALMAIFAALAFPTFAFAAEGEKGGVSAILPDMLEFVPMIIVFIILFIVLAKVGWPMFDGIIEKRNSTINEALKKSEEARIESERVLEEYKKQLADAKAQAAQIVADAKQAGEAVRADITKQAQEEAAVMIEKARVAIEVETKAALADLQGSIASLSVDGASRMVANDLSDDEHRAIIERYVSEAGSFHAN